MLRFQGMIFKDKEDLDEYINSQTTNVTTDTEQLISKLQECFNYRIIDITEITEDDYKIYFQTNDNIIIEHLFSSNENVEVIKKRLQTKTNVINQIILAVENMGIEEIKCTDIKEQREEILYKFEFKIHKEDAEFKEIKFTSNNNINDFIKNFRQYTSNKLEGKPTILDWWNGKGIEIKEDDEFDIPLKIDGIEVNGLLKRALKQHKHIRLEIVE